MADPVTGGVRRTRRRIVALLVALLFVLLASGVFVQRGVSRGLTGSHDLTMMYAGARQWVQGGNPYPLDAAYDAYQGGGGGAERPRDPKWFAQLYPPTTYAVMAPVGALPWPGARALFCGLNLAGWAVAGWWAWAAVGRPGLGVRGWGLGPRRGHGGMEAWRPNPQSPIPNPAAGCGGLLLAAAFLAWAPMHTTLAFGQLGGVVVGLVCLGLGGLRQNEKRKAKSENQILNHQAAGASGGCRPFALGKGAAPVWLDALRALALAVACCLKPQLAGLFVVVLAAAGRWRAVGWTCGWGLLIAALAVGRLMTTAPTWWQDLRSNVAAFAGTGFADPSPANSYAWQMINLEPWLRHVGAGEALAGGLPWMLGGAALIVAGCAAVRARSLAAGQASPNPESRTPNPGDEVALPHLLAVAAVVSLLVVYHRSYDAVLLVFPAVWAWRRVAAGGWRGAGGAAAALIAVIGLPLPAVLSEAVRRGGLPGGLAETTWWVPGVLMHQNVALLLLLGVLCVGGAKPKAQSEK